MECSEWIDFRNGRLFFLVLFYFCIRWVDETHLNFNGQSVNGSKICFNWDSAYAFISLFVVLLFCSSYFITHDHFLFNQHRLLALETYVLSFAVELSHPVGTRRMNPMCCLVMLLLLLSYSSASNKRRTFLFLLRMWKFRCGSQKTHKHM